MKEFKIRAAAIPQPIAFAVVGLTNTVFGFAVVLISLALGFGDYVANAVGYLIGIVFSFWLNRKWTFGGTGTASAPELLRFAITVLASYGVSPCVIATGRAAGLRDSAPLQACAIISYSIVFFFLSRQFVFAPLAPIADRPTASGQDLLATERLGSGVKPSQPSISEPGQ